MQPFISSGLSGRPVLFGELLFDAFPDGSEALGGAPFNVAWHLQGFGLQPLLISRVGADAQGERALETLRAWGMDTRGVQIDAQHSTGVVQVELQRGEPSYTILPSRAYDFIERAAAMQALRNADPALFYHGTLIARTSASYDTLHALRAHQGLAVFVDINLRNPWWSGDIVEALLRGARWAKMNVHELAEITNVPVLKHEDVEDPARELRQRYDLDLMIVTLGTDGAVFVTRDEARRVAAAPVKNLVNSVGAGDAFSAVALLGLLRGWDAAATQQRALEFAAAICQLPAAVSADPALYKEHLARWRA